METEVKRRAQAESHKIRQKTSSTTKYWPNQQMLAAGSAVASAIAVAVAISIACNCC